MRWSEPGPLVALAVGAVLLSALGTAWAGRHARRRGLLDAPGMRRSHALPTARGGGIGIVAVGLGTFGLLSLDNARAAGLAGIGLLLVAAVGWWDDHRPLPAWPRLLAHVVAGLCLGLAAAAWGAPSGLAVVAGLLVPVLVNIWNFIDGIDGLSASQALLWMLALAWLATGPARVLAVAISAGCAGFLPFNFPRARIFLGDVGSGALGYLLAAGAALAMIGLPREQLPLLLLPATACWVDASLTLGWRMVRGERWWQPHVQHLYQQLARRVGHVTVTLAYAGWTLGAIAIMLAMGRSGGPAIGSSALAFATASVAMWHYLQNRIMCRHQGIGR